ncbi:MAG TPA: ImmA/IrrE family metallo-endopeptidase [Stellaceae bacterium]|nr:ImmA/IrrE family metallo-endopeptidase [Stellaceae bacterium]
MDELSAVLKARELVKAVNPMAPPVSVEAYLEKVGAVLRQRKDLDSNEPGWSFEHEDKRYVCVNANDSDERRRFTICHEIAHIVLELPSDHSAGPWWSYAKRSPNEIWCDVFAAELLLPYNLFKSIAERMPIGFESVVRLAGQFDASVMATGSRFATLVTTPCAFVLSEQGKVRYTSRSTPLREVNAWITPRVAVPTGSVTERVRAGGQCDGPEEVDADIWFSDWDRGGVLLEEARHLASWDQTQTLLWFENEEVPEPRRDRFARDAEEGEPLLRELDGILPWPGKKRRK